METEEKLHMDAEVVKAGMQSVRFDDEDILKLWNAKYNNADRLRMATRDGLEKAGLAPGVVDAVLTVLGRASNAGLDSAVAAVIVQRVKTTVESTVQRNFKGMQKSIKGMQKSITGMQKSIKAIAKMTCRVAFTPKSTSSNTSAYRPAALRFYTGLDKLAHSTCAVSGLLLPAPEVKAGRIYQQRWPLMDGLDFDYNDPRNILLMQKKIEHAFDMFWITVLPGSHKVFVLKKDILEDTAFMYEACSTDGNGGGGESSSDRGGNEGGSDSGHGGGGGDHSRGGGRGDHSCTKGGSDRSCGGHGSNSSRGGPGGDSSYGGGGGNSSRGDGRTGAVVTQLKEVKWKDLHEKQLSLKGDNQPSDMALGVHAKFACDYAVVKRWMTDSDLPAMPSGDTSLLMRFLEDASASASRASSGAEEEQNDSTVEASVSGEGSVL